MTAARVGRPYRRLWQWQRQQGLACWLCGHPIDYSLRWPHTMSFSLDHVVPLEHGGSLLDPANAASAHVKCNCRRRDTLIVDQAEGTTSQRW